MSLDQIKEVNKCKDESRLMALLKEDSPGVAIAIAKSKHVTERILEHLTHNPSIIVRHEVAKNSKTAILTLERLSEDRDMLIRDYAKLNLLKRNS